MKVTVGSRESKLAVIQSEIVINMLKRKFPDIKTELVTMKTTGDKILDRTLDKVGGKGLFVKELDAALLDGRIDIAVHSFKDMPMEENEELPIAAVTVREDPRDVLILPQGVTEIDYSKPLGSASLRRTIQLKQLFPGIKTEPIRGNVQTRLAKLDSGMYSGIVLAYAGIKRLGLEDRVSRIFTTEEIIPAACQGILAVQSRKDFNSSILRCLHDSDTFLISQAERSFVRTLDGGCSAPTAAYAEIHGELMTLSGFYADESENIFRETIECSKYDGAAAGAELANKVKSRCLSNV